MNINDLDKIRKVEVPPFLLTRIQQKIETLNTATLTKKTAWALGLSFSVIVVLNIGLILKSQVGDKSMETYAQSIHLNSNNTLYK